MPTQSDTSRAKVSVQARVDADTVDKIDALGKVLDWTRSELVDFACQQIAPLSASDILEIMLKATKAKGKTKG